MSTLSLINPTCTMGVQALTMINEIGAEDGGFQGLDRPLTSKTLGKYIATLLDQAAGRRLPEGYVPMSTYWLVSDGRRLVGISRLRHRLTDSLLRHGGHIGYWLRPTERGKGYGTRLLSLTCEKAAALGIERVLLTCARTNIRSVRVIEANGGVLDTSLPGSPQEPELHFWIYTKAAQPDASPNGGPATPLRESAVAERPPSVS